MNVAELVATLVLDSAGFQSEIRKVDATLSQTGQKAEGMAQTLGTSVESAVESSVSKAGKSFGKLAQMAHGALAQWNGSGAVQKATQACQEQSAIMEKAADGVAGKAAGTIAQGLEHAQSSIQAIQARLPKWFDMRQPEAPADLNTIVSTPQQEKQEQPTGSEKKWDDVSTVLTSEPVQLPPAMNSELLPEEDASLMPSSPLVLPVSIVESVAEAVGEALRQAVNQTEASLARADTAQVAEMSDLPSIQLEQGEPPEAVTLSAARPLGGMYSDVGSNNEAAYAQAEQPDIVPPVFPRVLPHILPENLPDTLSEDAPAVVTAGVSESVRASMAAITPQAAESFAQSGAQLAQTVLTGMQNSVAAVLAKVPLMVASVPSASTVPTISSGAGTGPAPESVVLEQAAENAPLPYSPYSPDLASAFPAALYEPLAVTPPKAEPFAADFGNTITSQTSISQITINSQATDAEGIADDIGGELERRNLGYQFDGAYSV